MNAVAHITLIALHTAFATTTFVLGATLMAALPASVRSRRFVAYCAAAFLAIALLIIVVIVDWGQLPLVKRVAFSGLGLLGLYMLWRTERARETLARQASGWRTRFIGHVGFVLISLFDGFCIVTAIDLRLAPWLVAVVAVLGVALGVLWIRIRVRHELAREADPALPA